MFQSQNRVPFRVVPMCLLLAAVVSLGGFTATAIGQVATEEKPKLEKAQLGRTANVHRFGNFWLSGQFTPDDIAELKKTGITTVVTLRTDGELTWDEKKRLEDAGIKYIAIPFRQPETLTDDVFGNVRKVLNKAAKDKDEKVLMHCGSANRVGAVWAAFRALDQHVPLEDAIKEAREVGLRTTGYELRLKDYVRRAMQKQNESQDK